MPPTDEYSDNSFDNFIRDAINDGTIDYLEEKSILQMKLKELEENSPASPKRRVAQQQNATNIAGGVPKRPVKQSEVPKGVSAERMRAMEDTMKQME